MGKSISFFSPKGGSGKSTLTAVTVTALNMFLPEKSCAILDADSTQNTLLTLRKTDEYNYENDQVFRNFCDKYSIRHYPIELALPDDLNSQIVNLNKQFDFVFVDLPGTLNDPKIIGALGCLDYMIVPISDRPLEVDSVINFIENYFPIILKYNKNLKIKFLLNLYSGDKEAKRRTVNPYDVLEELLVSKNFEVFKSRVYERADMRSLLSTLKPMPAKESKDSVYNFIEEFIKLIM